MIILKRGAGSVRCSTRLDRHSVRCVCGTSNDSTKPTTIRGSVRFGGPKSKTHPKDSISSHFLLAHRFNSKVSIRYPTIIHCKRPINAQNRNDASPLWRPQARGSRSKSKHDGSVVYTTKSNAFPPWPPAPFTKTMPNINSSRRYRAGNTKINRIACRVLSATQGKLLNARWHFSKGR